AAVVRPERGVVHRQGALQRGRLLPRPAGRQPRRGSLHTLTCAGYLSADGDDLGLDQAAVGDVQEAEGAVRLPPPVGGRSGVEDPLAALRMVRRDLEDIDLPAESVPGSADGVEALTARGTTRSVGRRGGGGKVVQFRADGYGVGVMQFVEDRQG